MSSAILYRSEVSCQRENVMGSARTERSIMRAMCGVQFKDRKRAKEMMPMLD